ncbi:hypothetical protein D3C80_905840 [compost metagenome]
MAEAVRGAKHRFLDMLVQVWNVLLEQRRQRRLKVRRLAGQAQRLAVFLLANAHRTHVHQVQVGRLHHLLPAHQQGMVNGVLQLANIPRPAVREQFAFALQAQAGAAVAQALAVFFEEELGQRQDVPRPFAQRRQADGCHVQAVEQVFAKMPGHHRIGEVDVGRRHQAHVDRDRRARAQAHHFALLQHPQQFHLHVQRQVADFIEEQRAAIGRFEPAGLAVGGAGKGALLVTEQFALDQGFGKGAAVNRHERLAPAAAELMDVAGDQLLAGAGLADDQGVGFTRRQAFDAAEQFLGARVLEHQNGGANGFGQFPGMGMGYQRHGAFLAVKAQGHSARNKLEQIIIN